MYCPECGKQIADDVKFCPECGKAIQQGRKSGAAGATRVGVARTGSSRTGGALRSLKFEKNIAIATLGALLVLSVLLPWGMLNLTKIPGADSLTGGFDPFSAFFGGYATTAAVYDQGFTIFNMIDMAPVFYAGLGDWANYLNNVGNLIGVFAIVGYAALALWLTAAVFFVINLVRVIARKKAGMRTPFIIMGLYCLWFIFISTFFLDGSFNSEEYEFLGIVSTTPWPWLVLLLSAVGAVFGGVRKSHNKEKTASLAYAQVGNIVNLGTIRYNSKKAGTLSKNLNWLVLAISGAKVLVVSESVVDFRAYNTEDIPVTWEQSSLRHWLNNDFFNSLSEYMKKSAQSTKVVNKNNAEYGTPGGNETEDKVFLLSSEEADKYFSSDVERVAKWKNATGWWLRTPGMYADRAMNVDVEGFVSPNGDYVGNGGVGVRPALWLKP